MSILHIYVGICHNVLRYEWVDAKQMAKETQLSKSPSVIKK